MEELKKEVAEMKEILLKLLKTQCKDFTIELKSPNELIKECLKREWIYGNRYFRYWYTIRITQKMSKLVCIDKKINYAVDLCSTNVQILTNFVLQA